MTSSSSVPEAKKSPTMGLEPNSAATLNPLSNKEFLIKWGFEWQDALLFKMLLLALLITVAYGHTLDVPFYLDDYSSIAENTYIRDIDKIDALWVSRPLRFVGYITLTINHHLHQFQVAGYHLLNILIHFLAGLTVMGVVSRLLASPNMSGRLTSEVGRWLPLIVAILFIVHPLQTQAVTYIIQRVASLAALFYLLAIFNYLQWRLKPKLTSGLGWLALAGLCWLAGLLTKQNTATLPLAIFLLELVFFAKSPRHLFLTGLGFFFLAGGLWVLYCIAAADDMNPFSIQTFLAVFTKLNYEPPRTPSHIYFSTQLGVLFVYIKTFFYPVGLQLERDYPLHSLLELRALGLTFAHLAILTIAALQVRRWPLLAYGVFFYYTAHIIESSVVPIEDIIFEHRTYLPNFGLFCIVGWILVTGPQKLLTWLQSPRGDLAKQITIGLVALLVVTLTTMTWQRNQMWRDPVVFFRSNVEQVPTKVRARAELARVL